ncbi:MAG: DegV family protein [Coprococcus sp.]|nr:DegV family protein [Coprococcus sp.]
MRTAIVTDTNSGITKEEAKEEGIYLLPMPVIIDEEVCFEGANLSQERFYECLTGGKDVTTSQPAPADVMDLWDHVLEDGYDELVHIPMSSGLSNSWETAAGLSRDYDGKVMVVDNHRISVTLRESVLEAKRLADSGMTAEKIKEELEAASYDASIYIVVDTLEYLKKGGRITPAVAALGSVLNIKPVLTIQGGRLDTFAKVRGMKKAKTTAIEALRHDIETRFPDVEKSRMRLAVAGAALPPEDAKSWCTALSEEFQMDVSYSPLSFSVATHTGPGAVGVAVTIARK